MTTTSPAEPPQRQRVRVHRVEVRTNSDQPDPSADHALAHLRGELGDALAQVRVTRVYLIEAALDQQAIEHIAGELLADPVTQRAVVGAESTPDGAATFEVHYKPGVMDPVAQSAGESIAESLGLEPDHVRVRTGCRYDLIFHRELPGAGKFPGGAVVKGLANPVIQTVHDQPYHPDSFAKGSAYNLKYLRVPIRDLDADGLADLSRRGHLFLNLEEMRAIQDYFRRAGREPTDIELETLAQTWSEHCVHKTLRSTIQYTQDTQGREAEAASKPLGRRHPDESDQVPPQSPRPRPGDWADRPGHTLGPDGSITINNLLKSTIAAATHKLMEQDPIRGWCVSVFEDNAGIVRFDEHDGVCIKVETHNHPSAIEPYGGAATGIGGCIRDIMGTGLSARPIANTDVFCVAPADTDMRGLPPTVIPPARILEQVVAGVRDYGNRVGIPTVSGAVCFHGDYVANPLVFAGCVGLIPLDRCFGSAQPGDRIIVLGGRTGRDGIHGATFSSAELTGGHADEFGHAVQIGNPITQKKTLDVLLQARDHPDGCLFSAITDCGAGGFSSAVGEMAQSLGAHVTLETAPLKYQGLGYTEIWISEAQERMVLAVPPTNVDRLMAMCAAEDVQVCDLGCFGAELDGGEPGLILMYEQVEVGRLSMRFLHEGLPKPVRTAHWSESAPVVTPAPVPTGQPSDSGSLAEHLYALLAHPDIASKHAIIRQYDHEVQGGSVVKPLVGPCQDGPSDAAVLRPKLTGTRGIALGVGLQPGLGEKAVGGQGDSYWMALASIDEAVRNVVCVGADPTRIALLDNFCWPGCDDPSQLGSLVRAAEACYDGALAYRTPFVSGKDSLSNQFTLPDGRVLTIPPTLLITAMGIVPDVMRCCTMDAKRAGNLLLVVGSTSPAMGGSHLMALGVDKWADPRIPRVDLDLAPRSARAVAELIQSRWVASAHDCSEGGLLVAAAEMAFAGRIGLELDLADLPTTTGNTLDPVAACFAETPGRYLLEIAPAHLEGVKQVLGRAGIPYGQVGKFASHDRLSLCGPGPDGRLDEPLDRLRQVWLDPLDW